jgi:hypothetical protein
MGRHGSMVKVASLIMRWIWAINVRTINVRIIRFWAWSIRHASLCVNKIQRECQREKEDIHAQNFMLSRYVLPVSVALRKSLISLAFLASPGKKIKPCATCCGRMALLFRDRVSRSSLICICTS